ncbi:MAG TPA: hypothetical protein GXZ65_03410 [Clostridiales bacterium]|nr:hypothetical protein [Clostridiales bacterium]
MKYSVFKKTVSVLLAILILLSLLPAGVLAAEEGGTEESEENSAVGGTCMKWNAEQP